VDPMAKPRILLVDDHPINLKVAEAALEKLGCEVVTAANGMEAVGIAQGKEIALILMDCHMPQLNGFEATRELRTRGCHTPIAGLSAGEDADRERALEAGMIAFLKKPASLVELQALLSEHTELAFEKPTKVASFTPPTEAELLVFNIDSARETVGQNERILRLVVEQYLKVERSYLGTLEERVLAGCLAKIRDSAHAIKGAAASIGAERVRRAARSIEELPEKDQGSAQALLDALKDEEAELVRTLRSYLDN